VGHVRIDGTDTFQTTSLDMTSSGWGDVIQSLELAFEGGSGTVIEIDAIQIYR
jgi:hypothetical protein